MAAQKWTEEEQDRAASQVDSMIQMSRTKTTAGALAIVSVELACQRNDLRKALEWVLETREIKCLHAYPKFDSIYANCKGRRALARSRGE